MREAKEKILKSIEHDFIEGKLSPQAFTNIMGHPPDKELAMRCLTKYQYKTTPLKNNDFTIFAQKAFESFVKIPSPKETNA